MAKKKDPSDIIHAPSGMSIFIPNSFPSPTKPDPDFDEFFNTDFFRQSKWRKLIAKIIEKK